jgi:hypothetical protein
MIGIELYNRLIDAGHSIPTILVTAYPNDVEHACSRLSHGAGNTRGSHRNELTGVARKLDRACDESRKSGVWFGGALSRCMEALANLSNIEWADGSRGVLK